MFKELISQGREKLVFLILICLHFIIAYQARSVELLTWINAYFLVMESNFFWSWSRIWMSLGVIIFLIDLSHIHVNKRTNSRLGWTKYSDLYEIVYLSLVLISLWFIYYLTKFLQVKRGADKPKFQVVIMHALYVCSQHAFGLPLRMNGMHRMQLDHLHLDLLSLVIWSHMFWASITWILCKAQCCWSKNVLSFIYCHLQCYTWFP